MLNVEPIIDSNGGKNNMSLENLFLDRKVRKSIRESIFEAPEVGSGVCEDCGTETLSLIRVNSKCLCENCCNQIIESTYDYDRVFSEADVIDEAYIEVKQLQKLKDDAKNNFNDSIPDLLASYGIKANKDWNFKWGEGKLYIQNNYITSPNKARTNQFLLDYDCELPKSFIDKLAPDADGTFALASKGVTPPATPVQTSSTVKTPKAATTASPTKKAVTKSVAQKLTTGSGYTVTDSGNVFEITLAKSIGVSLVASKNPQTATTGGKIEVIVTYDGITSVTFMLDEKKSSKEMADEIIDTVIKEPGQFFTAFDDAKGEYQLEAYPAFTFVIDKDSFDGENITLAIRGDAWNGKRVPLSKEALTSRARLNGELLKQLEARMEHFYPCAFNGVMNVKTSLGKANTSLVTVVADSSDKMGRAKLHTELANGAFDWFMGGSQLSDKEISKNSVYDAIYTELPKIIPGWDAATIDSRPLAGDSKGFSVDFQETTSNGADIDISIYGSFSLNTLYDTGNIVIKMSIIDKRTGNEEPKKSLEVVYNKAKTPIASFLTENGKKIYKKYFSTSNMTKSLTQSAQAKVENKSKKIAFLSKIANNLKNRITHDGRAGGSCDDLDFKIEQFDVNKDGMVTKVVIRISDPDEILVTTANPNEWKNQVHFTKSATWAKLDKIDTTPKSLRDYGVSALYTVTDIEAFSNDISLYLAESAELLLDIFEGELVEVSEGATRKTISL